MRDRIASEGLQDRIRVVGGGTHARHGYTATEDARRVLAERSIDISDHRSHPTDRGLMEASDLILTATRSHARSLRFEFQDHAHKVQVLREFGKPGTWRGIEDVDDPVGQGLEAYRVTADLLEEQMERVWPLVLGLAAAGEGQNADGPVRESPDVTSRDPMVDSRDDSPGESLGVPP